MHSESKEGTNLAYLDVNVIFWTIMSLDVLFADIK